ncbi:MAG: zinc ribbon domain-containing protein [Gammaproteobacteria bacterium]|jgi:putative FmdB family regulatory protein
MPIYEYRCKACEHETEALQKMDDKPLRKCPQCGRMQLQRLISAPSFRLKGAGWYETDFKSEKENKRNIAGDAAEKSDTDKPSDKKTDKKEGSKGASSTAEPGKKSEPRSDDKSGNKKPGDKSSSSAVA